MQYILTTGWEDGRADLTKQLIDNLAEGNRVLWLVSGGSNIEASTHVMDHITDELSGNLTIGLIDERYGPVGHADSNWQQLMDNGFNVKAASTLQVLAANLPLSETADQYNIALDIAFKTHDLVVAQVGIGADGHVAGILPRTAAADELSKLVTGYTSKHFDRITVTPAAFSHFDLAYAFAFGDNKRMAIQCLQKKELSVSEQPAQILKTVKKSFVYSDQLGD